MSRLLEVFMAKAAPAVILCLGLGGLLSACDDDGLSEGNPNYFTSSRGQFTATLEDGTKLYLLPGSATGTATLTFDGSTREVNATQTAVNVSTYSGELMLPESITADDGQTYTLTAIGEQALMGCRTLTSVVVPATVQTMGNGAFAICQELLTATLPEGIAEIPFGCFGNCKKLNNLTVPSTVSKIGDMAFYGCNNLVTYHFLSTTPPVLEGPLFVPEGKEVTIIVPAGAAAAYQAAEGYGNLTIEEETNEEDPTDE